MSEKEIKTEKIESWDLIITPRKKWWDLQLRDVWHYRDFMYLRLNMMAEVRVAYRV